MQIYSDSVDDGGFETDFNVPVLTGIFDGALNCWQEADPITSWSELGVTGRGQLDTVNDTSLLQPGVEGSNLCTPVDEVVGWTPSFRVSVESDGVAGRFRLILELRKLPESETVSDVVVEKTVRPVQPSATPSDDPVDLAVPLRNLEWLRLEWGDLTVKGRWEQGVIDTVTFGPSLVSKISSSEKLDARLEQLAWLFGWLLPLALPAAK